MINKIKFLASLLLFISPMIAWAADSQQAAQVTVESGDIIATHWPADFSFGSVFIDRTTPITVYKTLDPDNRSNLFVVEDADSTGLSFYETVTISNLINSENIIPFTNIAMVTLSNDPLGADRVSWITPPADQGGITTPYACLWQGNLVQDCETTLQNNTFLPDIVTEPADPTLPVDAESNTVYVLDPTIYRQNEIIEFDNGEKALVLHIFNGIDKYLTVRRGLLGTTIDEHSVASGIKRYGESSIQVEIMDGPEPAGGRIGAYSIGFGFSALINPEFTPGNYSGTITFTLYKY